MNKASKLIERMEKEAGCRVDANGFNNNAVAGLLGAISRELGQSPEAYQPKEDMAAGILIKHQLTPEYKAEQERKARLAGMLAEGMPPEMMSFL